MTNNRRFSPQLAVLLLAWLGFALALTAHYIYQAPPEQRAHLYNADLFYLPDLITDLGAGGDSSLWSFSNTPYIFPDIAILAFVLALTNNIALTVAVGGVIQILLFVGGLAWLATRLYGQIGGTLSAICAACFFVVLRSLDANFQLIQLNGYHVGVLVVLPYVLVLSLALIEETHQRVAWVLLAALVFLTTLSDALFVPQVSAPLAVMAILLALRGALPLRWSVRFVVLLAAASALGLLAGRVLLPTELVLLRMGPADAVATIVRQLSALFAAHPWLAICWGLFIACSLLELIGWWMRPKPEARHRVLVLGAIIAGFPLILLAMVVQGVTLERYMLNLLYLATFLGWPLLLGGWLEASRARQRLATMCSAGVALALVAGSVPQLRAVQSLGHYTQFYPPLVACLDAHAERFNLQHGITQYWQARLINLFSHQGLEAAQFQPNLKLDHWTNSLVHYREPFDFVVVDVPPHVSPFSLLPEVVQARFGEPDARFACGASEVYVYRSDGHYALHAYNRFALLDHYLQPGMRTSFAGAVFTGMVGQNNGAARVSGVGQRGYLVLGSAMPIAPGSYQLDLRYQASGVSAVGALDIVARHTDDGHEIELGEGLPLVATPGSRLRVRFQIVEPGEMDLQLYVNGTGAVSLQQVALTKLGS